MVEKRFKKVYVEISNACNLKCDFCPTVNKSQTFMDASLFEKIVSQLPPLTNAINLHIMGEPLLHPQLDEFIHICAAHNLPVTIVTNGTLMTPEKQELLLHPIVQQVNFSLQSFHANFPNADNSAFLNRIFQYTLRAFEQRPDLHVNYRLWNVSDYSDAISFNEDLIKKMKMFFDIENASELNHISLRGRKVTKSLHLNLATRFDWPDLDMPFRSTHGTCPGLITQLGVLADGTVVPCCLDKDGIVDLGNCNDGSIKEIITSDKATRIINGFKCRELIEPLCQHCTFIERFEKKVRWIKGHQTWVKHNPQKNAL